MNNLPDDVRSDMTGALLFKRWSTAYARWRALALVLLLGMGLYGLQLLFSTTETRDRFVRIQLDGVISDMDQVRKASALLDDVGVKGVLVVANSPGGSPVVSEAWAALFRRLQKKNIPVVAIAEELCASGCYLAVSHVNRIFSYENSLIGSVGALLVAPNYFEFLKKFDIHYDVIKSGLLKGEPNPLGKPNPLYHDEMQNLVNASGGWFAKQVVQARSIQSDEYIERISSGEIFIASLALKMNLIDEVADEIAAKEFLKSLSPETSATFETLDVQEYSWMDELLGLKKLKQQMSAWLLASFHQMMFY